MDDLPKAFGLIGPAAIPALRSYLADPAHGLWTCLAAAEGLQEIGKQHPDARDECVVALTEQLERFAELDPTLNGLAPTQHRSRRYARGQCLLLLSSGQRTSARQGVIEHHGHGMRPEERPGHRAPSAFPLRVVRR